MAKRHRLGNELPRQRGPKQTMGIAWCRNLDLMQFAIPADGHLCRRLLPPAMLTANEGKAPVVAAVGGASDQMSPD